MNQVEIQCFPTDVPEQIEFDVSNLEINNSCSVSDLIAPSEEIVITSPPEINVVSIHMPVEEEVIEEDEMALDSDEQLEEAEDSAEQSDESKEKEDDSN